MKRLFIQAALAAVVLLNPAANPARAGRACDEQPQTTDAVARGMGLALRTAQALDASDAQVLVLARAGQDLSAYGLRWSHLGFVYRDVASADGAPGPWRVLHKLNACGSADAALYRQGLGEFFLDRPQRYQAVVMPLTPALQAVLLPLLRDNQAAARLHEARYNMLAYPWSQDYQQSNQWAIETLALAAEPCIANRAQAQAWLKLKGYQPTVLQLGAFTRLGARVTRANVAFDDHPNSERFADRIATTTVDSVLAWLPRAGLAGAAVMVD